ENAWIRFDLARFYIQQGAHTEARGVVDGLLLTHPDHPDALYASALVSAQLGDWRKGYDTLMRIPAGDRTREMNTLGTQLWVQAQAAEASALARAGRRGEALGRLGQAEPYAGADPVLLGALASAYVDAGDSTRAMGLIRQLMAKTGRNDPAA